MIPLMIITVLASFSLKRAAASRGYGDRRVLMYPVAILLAVLIPANCAEAFIGFAASRNLCGETAHKIISGLITVMSFAFYLGALSRCFKSVKNLPNQNPERESDAIQP